MHHSELIHRTVTSIVLIVFFCGIYTQLPPYALSITLLFLYALIMYHEWPVLTHMLPKTPYFIFIKYAYPTVPFIALIFLNHGEPRILLPLLCLIIFSFDVGGYILGKLYGKHQLTPISPGKTWEGVIGGIFFAVGSALLFYPSMSLSLSLLKFISLTLILCCAGLFGDLFESWLKRRANIKDASSLLPGHGGLLDRLDGLLIAAVVLSFLKIGHCL